MVPPLEPDPESEELGGNKKMKSLLQVKQRSAQAGWADPGNTADPAFTPHRETIGHLHRSAHTDTHSEIPGHSKKAPALV